MTAIGMILDGEEKLGARIVCFVGNRKSVLFSFSCTVETKDLCCLALWVDVDEE